MTYQNYIRSYLLQECYNTLNANNTEDKILDFEDIKDGWHFGEGIAVSRRAIQDACRLHDTLLEFGFYETDAFPGLAGEVRVTAYWKDYYFEFTREFSGLWRFIEELNGTEIEDAERDNLNLSDAQTMVGEIAQHLWTTFATSHECTGTNDCNDFKAWPLNRPQTAESPSSSGIVSSCIDLSANTYDFITRNPGNPPFSGNFATPFYPMARPLFPPPQTPTILATERSSEFQFGTLSAYLKPIVISPKITNLEKLKLVWGTVQGPSRMQIFPRDTWISGPGQASVRYPTSSVQSVEALCHQTSF